MQIRTGSDHLIKLHCTSLCVRSPTDAQRTHKRFSLFLFFSPGEKETVDGGAVTISKWGLGCVVKRNKSVLSV